MVTADLGLLYEEYSDMVKAVSLRGTHDFQAAEDVRQQVFINVFKSLKSFRNDCQIKTWIYQITLNECYQYRLKNWREARKITAYLENLSQEKNEVDHWDDKLLVQSLLDLADSETLKAMELLYEKQLTQGQIAQALGVSRVTVNKRLDKFRDKAVAAMGEEG